MGMSWLLARKNKPNNSASETLKVFAYVLSFGAVVIGAGAAVKYGLGPLDKKKANAEEPEPPIPDPPTFEPPTLPTEPPLMWTPEPPAEWPMLAPWPPRSEDWDMMAQHYSAQGYIQDYSGSEEGAQAASQVLPAEIAIIIVVVSMAVLMALAAKAYLSSSASSTVVNSYGTDVGVAPCATRGPHKMRPLQ